MKKQRYITVVHSKGATYGYDGPFAPISHRFLWDGSGAFGADSLTLLFHSYQEMTEHFQQFVSSDSGQVGDFTWSVD